MIKPYLSYTQSYPINRTDTVTLNDSYLALKQGVIAKAKTAVSNLGVGFTLADETVPTASASQTIVLLYDTPLGYQFRQVLTFSIQTSGTYTIVITLASEIIKVNVTMPLHAVQTIASSLPSPTEVVVDSDSICATTPNCFAIGFLRANQTVLALANIFDTGSYTMFRYKSLQTGDYAWGGVREATASMPLNIITTAVAAIAYPMQMTTGFLKSSTSVYQLLSLNEVYFNETSTATSNFICKVDSDAEMLLVTMPSPIIPTGTKVKIGNNSYYIIVQLNGKAALALV